MNFLKEALNKITDEVKIPDICRKSILIPIYRNKGDIMNCGNYRGITLTGQVTRATHVRNRICPRVKFILKIIIILLIIFLGFIKSKPC